MKRTLPIYILACFVLKMASPGVLFGDTGSGSPFVQRVGRTDWQVHLKEFTISRQHDGTTFSLRVGDGRRLSFGLESVESTGSASDTLGPLQVKNKAILRDLLECALQFSGTPRNGKFTLVLNWFDYPKRIRSWADVWRDSELRAKWNSMNRHVRYRQLTGMIAKHLQQDMAPVARAMGFTITGADMEKMGHPTPAELLIHCPAFDSSGLPADLTIPVPLMLSLALTPTMAPGSTAEPSMPATPACRVDDLFATAQRDASNVYCVYHRSLNEYEITGDTQKDNGTYDRMMPLSDPRCHPIAGQLLSASLKAAQHDQREKLSLRIHLAHYPKIYQDAVQHFTFKTGPPEKMRLRRAGIPNRQFHLFKPSSASLLPTGLTAFINRIGYAFDRFEMSLASKRKGSQYPDFKRLLKPIGIQPNDRPAVPDIVYMVLRKK